MALTFRSLIQKLGPLGGPWGMVASAVAGATDPETGEKTAKGLLGSKTIQGGVSLGAIPVFIFPLVDDAMSAPWNAWAKLILMCLAFGWLVYGRATASTPLVKGKESP